MHLRADRRVLFSVETGSALYHQDNEGNLVEVCDCRRIQAKLCGTNINRNHCNRFSPVTGYGFGGVILIHISW